MPKYESFASALTRKARKAKRTNKVHEFLVKEAEKEHKYGVERINSLLKKALKCQLKRINLLKQSENLEECAKDPMFKKLIYLEQNCREEAKDMAKRVDNMKNAIEQERKTLEIEKEDVDRLIKQAQGANRYDIWMNETMDKPEEPIKVVQTVPEIPVKKVEIKIKETTPVDPYVPGQEFFLDDEESEKDKTLIQ